MQGEDNVLADLGMSRVVLLFLLASTKAALWLPRLCRRIWLSLEKSEISRVCGAREQLVWQRLNNEDLFPGVTREGDGALDSRFDLDIRQSVESDSHVAILKFFSGFADEIHSFAERHSMRITKYYHDAPCWILRFHHPEGGVGRIDVSYKYQLGKPAFWDPEITDLKQIDPSPTLLISSSWASPDFPDSRKSSEPDIELEEPIDPHLLRAALQQHFKTVIGCASNG